MKLVSQFTLSLLVLWAGYSFAGKPAVSKVKAKKYNISCRTQDALSQPKEKDSEFLEVDLKGMLVVKGKKYSLVNLNSWYFAYEQDYQNSIRDAKRPSDALNRFGYSQAASIPNDPDFDGSVYKNHVQFRLEYDGEPWGDFQSAEFKFPKVTKEEDLAKEGNAVVLNLHYDQGWAMVHLKCSLSEQKE